jgi:ribosomal 50S subunit-associated protein YjgA (DUF615 family)
VREEVDVEDVFAVLGFFVGKQIKQQRANASPMERLRDKLIARDETAAAAAVCEKHYSYSVWRNREIAFQPH